jgi:hypothetical protein
MNDQTLHEQPLPPRAERLPPTDARQGAITGRVRYILAISVALVVIAFAIIYFVYA